MNTALIADIQRSSVHDGDGIRTTVFFKGCPLSCKWCHNPECISFEKQILFYPEKCIHCGRCDEGCFAGAKVVCGKEMTAEDILAEVIQDLPYYGEDGGVTFSGGEPMAQKDFLNQAVDLCLENNINCDIETSLLYFDEDIFKKFDTVMADLKIWNSDIHKEYTGLDNQKIIENFKKLDSLNIPIVARTPVISGIDQGIPQISAFFKTFKNIKKYELLPYHPLGVSKQVALGEEITRFDIPEKEYMDDLKSKYEINNN